MSLCDRVPRVFVGGVEYPSVHHITMTVLSDEWTIERVGELGMDLVPFGWTLSSSLEAGSPPPGHGPLLRLHLEGPSNEEALDLIRERAIEIGALTDG